MGIRGRKVAAAEWARVRAGFWAEASGVSAAERATEERPSPLLARFPLRAGIASKSAGRGLLAITSPLDGTSAIRRARRAIRLYVWTECAAQSFDQGFGGSAVVVLGGDFLTTCGAQAGGEFGVAEE